MTWSDVPIDEVAEDVLLATTGDRKRLVVSGTDKTFIQVTNASAWQEVEVNG